MPIDDDGPSAFHRNHLADITTAWCDLNGLPLSDITPIALTLVRDLPVSVRREYANGWWLTTTGTVTLTQRLHAMHGAGLLHARVERAES